MGHPIDITLEDARVTAGLLNVDVKKTTQSRKGPFQQSLASGRQMPLAIIGFE